MPPSLQPKRFRDAQQQAADAAMGSAQLPEQDAASSPRAATQSLASDRPKTARPKVIRKNLSRVNSSSSGSVKDVSSVKPDAGSDKATSVGVNMLYAGLKFTGLALNVAGDLAKSARRDAEKMMKDIEADATARVCYVLHNSHVMLKTMLGSTL